jgi:small conductance mechanosensitive channel
MSQSYPLALAVKLASLVFTCLSLLVVAPAALPSDAGAQTQLSAEDIDRVLATLEDETRREEVLKTLRALRDATQGTDAEDGPSVRTATTELFQLIADKSSEASKSAESFVEAMAGIPVALVEWTQTLDQPDERQQWLTTGGRLIAVLGAGLSAAWLLTWMLRRAMIPPASAPRFSLLQRSWRLAVRFVLDLLPIAGFALAAHGVLSLVDPRDETRLVAIALINASVLSRIVVAVSSFVLSPRSGALRLWSTGDESANYLHHWVRRLSTVVLYGYFGLHAALLLGIDAAVFETLMRLLGLIVLLLLLVLVAQNRREVANVIASEQASDQDEPASLSSFRLGLSQVWHLVASAYLIVVYVVWALRVQDGAGYLIRATALSLAALALGRLALHLVDQVFNRGLRLGNDVKAQFPDLERRLNRYFPVLRKLAKTALVIALVLVIGHAWGIDTLAWATEGGGRVFFGALLHILFMLAIALVLWELASGSIERYLADTDDNGRARQRSARTKTLLTVARNALLVVLTVVTVLMVLAELGINIAPLLAGAGVVGLAIGFGSQRLVQDIINGAFILFQDLMSVGDVVKLGDKAGVVEALSIRTVRLRDLTGTVHTIPFSSIEAVSNLTREFSFYVFDMGIAYREDVDEVIALIRKVGEELQQDPEIGPLMLEPVEIFGLDQFGDSAIVIKGRLKTKPIKQWAVGRAFNRLIKIRFDEHGIEIPFPHQTIYFGEDKDGGAPPLRAQIEGLQALAASPANEPAKG